METGGLVLNTKFYLYLIFITMSQLPVKDKKKKYISPLTKLKKLSKIKNTLKPLIYSTQLPTIPLLMEMLINIISFIINILAKKTLIPVWNSKISLTNPILEKDTVYIQKLFPNFLIAMKLFTTILTMISQNPMINMLINY